MSVRDMSVHQCMTHEIIKSVILSNSSPKSKVQTSVLGLGVDFVFPLSQVQQQQQQQQQQEQEQQEEPPPKSIKRGCTRGLKFDT